MKYYQGFFNIAGNEQRIFYSLYDWQTNHVGGSEITKQEFDQFTSDISNANQKPTEYT